jgi:transcription termination factor Rho
MAVLSRSSLQASPLADLHALASTLAIDGFRRLRKQELIDAILERQGGEIDDGGQPVGRVADEQPTQTERSRPEPSIVEGVVDLLPNGSGFVRVAPPDPADDDVYISAGQARRCELVSGDRVSGPVRAARRSERFPALVRIETINGVPAAEALRATRIEELEADFPRVLLPLGEADPTLAAIGRLAPIGRGSRAVIAGPSRSGKSEAVKRLSEALDAASDLTLEVLLVGIRPEELGEWKALPGATVSGLSFAAAADAQANVVEQAVERGRRVAARGGDAVLLIDTLDGLHPPAARRVLGAARNLRDGGSLTIIATAERPVGGETTVVVLDRALVASGRLPAVDPLASGTLRAELLVGEEGAEAIRRARAQLG